MKTILPILTILVLIFSGCVTESTAQTPVENTENNTPETPILPAPENTLPQEPPVTTLPEEPLPSVETFSLAEIAPHNTTSDCWTTIEGKVYNISEFTSSHPGGPGIVGVCGIDGTVLFTTRNGNGPHPPSAENTLGKYYIGELE